MVRFNKIKYHFWVRCVAMMQYSLCVSSRTSKHRHLASSRRQASNVKCVWWKRLYNRLYGAIDAVQCSFKVIIFISSRNYYYPWMQQIDIIANINITKMLQTFNIALHWTLSCQFSEVDSTKNVLICPRLVQVSQTDVSCQFFQSAATRPRVLRLHVSEATVCPHLSRSNKIMCLHSVCTIRY